MRRLLSSVGGAMILLASWVVVAAAIGNDRLAPGPWRVVRYALPSLAQFGGNPPSWSGGFEVLAENVAITVGRLLAGSAIGALAGVLAAAAVFGLAGDGWIASALLTCARAVPLFALVPLFLYWFSGGRVAIIAYIGFATFTIVSAGALESLRNVDPVFPTVARLLGAGSIRVATGTYAPAALPEILTTIRSALGLSWAFSLGAEYVSADAGLGFLAYQAYLYSDMGKLMVIACTYTVLGYLSFVATGSLRRIVKWSSNET